MANEPLTQQSDTRFDLLSGGLHDLGTSASVPQPGVHHCARVAGAARPGGREVLKFFALRRTDSVIGDPRTRFTLTGRRPLLADRGRLFGLVGPERRRHLFRVQETWDPQVFLLLFGTDFSALAPGSAIEEDVIELDVRSENFETFEEFT